MAGQQGVCWALSTADGSEQTDTAPLLQIPL